MIRALVSRGIGDKNQCMFKFVLCCLLLFELFNKVYFSLFNKVYFSFALYNDHFLLFRF